MYQSPKLERLGTFREVTLAGGAVPTADASNPYHRYRCSLPRRGGLWVPPANRGASSTS